MPRVSAVSSISCTPHFKDDAENPWITRESQLLIHYWFNPGKTQTLHQVVESIEAWGLNEYQQQVQRSSALKCCYPDYSLTIDNVEIRGTTYDRQAMTTLYTSSALHNEEPFTMRVHARVLVRCTIL